MIILHINTFAELKAFPVPTGAHKVALLDNKGQRRGAALIIGDKNVMIKFEGLSEDVPQADTWFTGSVPAAGISVS